MGPLDEKAQEAEKSTSKEKLSPHRLLKQLSDELDAYYDNPTSYDRKKLEALVVEFLEALKYVFASSHFGERLKAQFKKKSVNVLHIIRDLRRALQSDEVDDYGCDHRFEMTIKPFFDFLYYKYFRVSVQGVENIPHQGRALLVANHSGVLPYDASMIKVAVYNEHPAKRELRFLVDDFVFHFPFLGVLMNRIGGVRACPENAERLLIHDELVSVFPEGIKGISKHFSERYRLQRFGRGGFVKLALKTRSPIIPVAVIGAEEIHPLIYKSHVLARPLGIPFIPVTPSFPLLGPIGAIPLPTKWSIVFGKPIAFEPASPSDINDGILINRETEKLRALIQEMVYAVLKERRSVFFG